MDPFYGSLFLGLIIGILIGILIGKRIFDGKTNE